MTIEEEYNLGMSLRDLSKKYNVSHITIRNILLRKNINLRIHGTHTEENVKQIKKSLKLKQHIINKKISILLQKEKNPNWKGGFESENSKIKNEIFFKFDGICQDCKKQLFKGKRGQWAAHHLDINLKNKDKKEYMLSKDRILLCDLCHKKRHKEYKKCVVCL